MGAPLGCVLYLDFNLQLWLVPYAMKRDVGQSPRDIERAMERGGRSVETGWIWLGSGGGTWHGSLTGEILEETCRIIEGPAKDLGNHGEWVPFALREEEYPALHARASAWRARREGGAVGQSTAGMMLRCWDCGYYRDDGSDHGYGVCFGVKLLCGGEAC